MPEFCLTQSLMAQPALTEELVRIISEPNLWSALLMFGAAMGACRISLPHSQTIFAIGLAALLVSAITPMPLAFGLGLVGLVIIIGIGDSFGRCAINAVAPQGRRPFKKRPRVSSDWRQSVSLSQRIQRAGLAAFASPTSRLGALSSVSHG